MLKNALIVDDSRLARLTLKKLLVKYDIEVSEAEGVLDAEQWIIHNFVPDLVFMDVMMPDLDGFAGLARLRNNPDTQNVPVIMYSGDISEEARKKARDNGATGYLPKPADASRLDHLLNALIQRIDTKPEEEKQQPTSAPTPTPTPTLSPASTSKRTPESTYPEQPQRPVGAEKARKAVAVTAQPTSAHSVPVVSKAELKALKSRIEEMEMRQTMQELNTSSLDFDADMERQRRDIVFLQRQLASVQQQLKLSLILGGVAAFLAVLALIAHFI